jgi:hypothetical protein
LEGVKVFGDRDECRIDNVLAWIKDSKSLGITGPFDGTLEMLLALPPSMWLASNKVATAGATEDKRMKQNLSILGRISRRDRLAHNPI